MSTVIVRRSVQFSGLGALGGPLDTTVFTIPGIGTRISLRNLMQSICKLGGGDPDFCRLITSRPEDACKYMVQKGEQWITRQISAVISNIVDRVASGVSCSSNWKEALVSSIQFSFSKSGIDVSIDPVSLAKDLFCQIGKRAITGIVAPFITQLVEKLKSLCAAGANAIPGSSSSSIGSDRSPFSSSTPSGGSTTTSSTTSTPYTPVSQPKSVYSIKNSPKSSSSVLVWSGVGVALLGTTWFVFRRR